MKKLPVKKVHRAAPAKPAEIWIMRLYVMGQTSRCLTAFANLKKICDDHLEGKYRIEVIDILKNPWLAKGEQIIAIPTLVKKIPPPARKVIGDLADTERVLIGLDIRSDLRFSK